MGKKVFVFAVLAASLNLLADELPKIEQVTVLEQLGKIVSKRDIGMGGIMEFVVNDGQKNNIVYVSKDRKYLLFGALVNNKTAENITKTRYTELNKIDMSKVNLSEALKVGSGTTKLVAVLDPRCPHCVKSYEWLKTRDVELYVFLSPLGGKEDSVKILCNTNQVQALDEMLLKGNIADKNCVNDGETILKKHILASHIFGVQGTPLFVTMSGEKIEGFDRQALEKITKERQVGK